jgi:hypothetical protein
MNLRASLCAPEKSTGDAVSTIEPACMKATWSATSRAKFISWLTMIIVMPIGKLVHDVELP